MKRVLKVMGMSGLVAGLGSLAMVGSALAWPPDIGENSGLHVGSNTVVYGEIKPALSGYYNVKDEICNPIVKTFIGISPEFEFGNAFGVSGTLGFVQEMGGIGTVSIPSCPECP
jgi:hypothetical protein